MPKTPTTFPLRLDAELEEQLRLRAQLEGKSMNSIISDALREYFRTRPIPKAKLREFASRVFKNDAALLEALKDE